MWAAADVAAVASGASATEGSETGAVSGVDSNAAAGGGGGVVSSACVVTAGAAEAPPPSAVAGRLISAAAAMTLGGSQSVRPRPEPRWREPRRRAPR